MGALGWQGSSKHLSSKDLGRASLCRLQRMFKILQCSILEDMFVPRVYNRTIWGAIPQPKKGGTEHAYVEQKASIHTD